MKTIRSIIVIALAIGFVIPMPCGSAERKETTVWNSLTEGQREELLKGQVIFESDYGDQSGSVGGAGLCRIVINKDMQTCMAIFGDFASHYEYIPKMKISRVLKRDGNNLKIYRQAEMLFIKVEYTYDITIDPEKGMLTYQTDPEGPNTLKYMRGYYSFDPIDESKTLFTFCMLEMDAGFSVPKFISDYVARKELPGVAMNVKKRIESGGKWKKE